MISGSAWPGDRAEPLTGARRGELASRRKFGQASPATPAGLPNVRKVLIARRGCQDDITC